MACAPQDLIAYRGERVALTFNLALGSPAPDIGDWTLLWTLAIRKNAAVKTLELTPTIPSPPDNTVFLSLTSEHTDLAPMTYAWDLWRTDTDEETLLAIGTLRIRPDVRLPAAS